MLFDNTGLVLTPEDNQKAIVGGEVSTFTLAGSEFASDIRFDMCNTNDAAERKISCAAHLSRGGVGNSWAFYSLKVGRYGALGFDQNICTT